METKNYEITGYKIIRWNGNPDRPEQKKRSIRIFKNLWDGLKWADKTPIHGILDGRCATIYEMGQNVSTGWVIKRSGMGWSRATGYFNPTLVDYINNFQRKATLEN